MVETSKSTTPITESIETLKSIAMAAKLSEHFLNEVERIIAVDKQLTDAQTRYLLDQSQDNLRALVYKDESLGDVEDKTSASSTRLDQFERQREEAAQLAYLQQKTQLALDKLESDAYFFVRAKDDFIQADIHIGFVPFFSQAEAMNDENYIDSLIAPLSEITSMFDEAERVGREHNETLTHVGAVPSDTPYAQSHQIASEMFSNIQKIIQCYAAEKDNESRDEPFVLDLDFDTFLNNENLMQAHQRVATLQAVESAVCRFTSGLYQAQWASTERSEHFVTKSGQRYPLLSLDIRDVQDLPDTAEGLKDLLEQALDNYHERGFADRLSLSDKEMEHFNR